MKNLAIAIAASLCLTSVGACSSGKAVSATYGSTIAEELRDLKSALDDGLISQREYNRARKDVLRRYD